MATGTIHCLINQKQVGTLELFRFPNWLKSHTLLSIYLYQCLVINLVFIDSKAKRFREALDDCRSLKPHLATSWTIFGRAAKGKKWSQEAKEKLQKAKKGLQKAKKYCERQKSIAQGKTRIAKGNKKNCKFSKGKKVCRQRTGLAPKMLHFMPPRATAGSTTPRFAFFPVLLEVSFVQMISRNVVEWCLGPNFPKKWPYQFEIQHNLVRNLKFAAFCNSNGRRWGEESQLTIYPF